MHQLYEKISNILQKENKLNITLPDEKIEDVIISQYTYKVYSEYEVILNINDKKELEKLITYSGRKILLFVKDPDIVVDTNLFCQLNLKCIYFGRRNQKLKKFDFSISKNLAFNYICYLENEFPKIIFSDKDREEIINIGGYSFYNIYQIMQLCYFNQVTVEQIQTREFIDIEKEDKDIRIILNLCSKGIHINAIRRLIGNDRIEEYVLKKYVFLNGEYVIPNVKFKLRYKSETNNLNDEWWKNILAYIRTIQKAQDRTICQQVELNLKNTAQLDVQNEEIKECLYEIERALFEIYRFRENSILLSMIKVYKNFFKKDKEKWIRCLVDEAILYMDIEEFKVSKEKFKQALKFCKENSVKKELWVFVEDEYSRVLEKTGHYYEAVNKLYVVEQYYQEQKNEKKLNNVKNRIGLNLSFIGDIKTATEYLEDLLFGNFNKKIDTNNILSCEVACNLSICYMEAGYYKKALRIQNLLYQLYLRTSDTPKNYATDILQNKGSIYLYQHKYDEAFKCFEQAFNDETNPYSKELILENYLYAKGFLAKDFEESIIFFENQIKQSEINHETCKMLAEMYFANQNYSKCVRLCEKVLKKIVYKKEKFLYISLDIMYMSCLKKINKFTWKQIWGCWSRIDKYEQFVKQHVGARSPYLQKIEECKKLLKR